MVLVVMVVLVFVVPLLFIFVLIYYQVCTAAFLFLLLLQQQHSNTIYATTSGGPRAGIELASDKPKQEGKGLDCAAGLDAKPDFVVVMVVVVVWSSCLLSTHTCSYYHVFPGC